MIRKKLMKFPLKIILALSMVFTLSFPYSLLAESTIRFVPSDKHTPDNKGTPDSGTGTGTRGTCPKKDIPLIPVTGGEYNLELTLTTRDYPTFWFYIPYTSEEVVSALFSLQDQEGDEIFTKKLTLPTKPGIIGIALPPNVKPLEINYQYRWYLNINCPKKKNGDNYNSDPDFIKGIVIKVSEPEISPINTLPPLERVEIYAEKGIWYDTVTELAELIIAEPNNPELLTIWSDLLKSPEVGLENIAQEPIIGVISH